MRRSLCSSIVFECFLSSNLFALSIGVEGTTSPFIATYDPTLQPSVDLILQVVNETETTAVVLSWQLELEIRPISGAQGELLFHSAGAPPDSLFGQDPGPTTNLTSPSANLLAFDADTTEFDGEAVLPAMARNILELTLVASSNATGSFQVITPEFDPENPEVGSSWFEADGVEPTAFDNSTPSDFPGFVLLGTINVTRPFLPGDYDSDGVVGPLDYDRWRNQFGEPVGSPGEEADGNRDSLTDAADYVVWRKNITSGSGVAPQAAAPEPVSLNVAVLVVILWFRWPRKLSK